MSKKGGLSIPVLHCIFNGYNSVTHYVHELDREMYEALPNLYAICIADNHQSYKKIVAGLFIKTSYTHEEAEFLDVLSAIVSTTPELKDLSWERISFFPARLGVKGAAPLSEEQMLAIISNQRLKHAVVGNA